MPTTPLRLAPLTGIFVRLRTPISYQERLRMIYDSGFEATALWWEEANSERRRVRDRAPDWIRSAGLYLDNLHVPYQGCRDFWSYEAESRRRVVQQHIGWVKDCARHGIPRMVMHVVQGSSCPPLHDAAVDGFRALVDTAEELDITLAIENTRHDAAVDLLLQRIKSPALSLCYDSSHDWLHSDQPLALLQRWGHRLGATHFSDTDGILDRHWLPNDGVVDFDALARAYPSGAGATVCMLEVAPQRREEPAPLFLSRAYERCRALAARLA